MERDYRQDPNPSYRSGAVRRSDERWSRGYEGGDRNGYEDPEQSTSIYDPRERYYDDYSYGSQHEYSSKSDGWHHQFSEYESQRSGAEYARGGRHRDDYYRRDDRHRSYEDDYYGRREEEKQAWQPHSGSASTRYEEEAPQQDERHYPQDQPTPAMQLRLVKMASDVLPAAQEVAVIDGRGDGVSIGRDRSFTARIRCPSMEVSKHHANIFRMSTDQRGHDVIFAVADTGSTHGTYLLLDPPSDLTKESLPPATAYTRLSEAKKASVPKGLRHLSLLRVGRTVFQVHLHTGWSSSCSVCALKEDGSNEITLLASDAKEIQTNTTTSKKTSAASNTSVAAKNTITSTLAPKAALKALKSQHLGDEPEPEPETGHEPAQYVDRAAARRARGGVVVQAETPQKSSSSAAASTARKSTPTTSSEPAAKLNASNVGFKMFESMAMKGGESRLASHDPIMARGVEGRAGLGSKRLLDVQEMASQPSGYSAESVRERQRRRFEETR